MSGKILALKLSVRDFGEICNAIMDAFERGEPTVPTSMAAGLVGHIKAVYQEQIELEKRLEQIIETAQDSLQGVNRAQIFPSNMRPIMRRIIKIAEGENTLEIHD
jgi:hypothetical protein